MKVEIALKQISTQYVRTRILELNTKQYEEMTKKVNEKIGDYELIRMTIK
jgi:hypothetical protein